MIKLSPTQEVYFMNEAIKEAKKAYALGEVPIGCVLVYQGKIIARGHNLREKNQAVLAHAEIQAIQQANQVLKSWRLEDTQLFVTLEPCPMCAGAILNARIAAVYYGAYDLKAGCAGTLMNLLTDKRFNHQCYVKKGICQSTCQNLLQDFFEEIRQKNSEKD